MRRCCSAWLGMTASTSYSSHCGELAALWPGREAQIATLHSWLSGRGGSHIIVHGPPGTGKTSVVRSCLEAWGRRYAYATLPQEYKLRQLFAGLLSQLWADRGHKRKRAGGFGPVAGADSWNEFAEQAAAACPPGSPQCSVLVLDGMQWHAHANVLPQLLAAIRWHRASLVVVAITSTPPQDLRFGAASGLPLPLMRSVAFPAYSRDQLVEALAVNVPTACGAAAAAAASTDGAHVPAPSMSSCHVAPSPELYREFLNSTVVGPFCQHTRSAADLAAVAAWLWPLYSQPLEEGQVRPDAPVETQVRQLDGLLRNRHNGPVRRLLEVYRPGLRAPPPGALPQLQTHGSAAGVAAAGAAGGQGAGVEAEAYDSGRALTANLGKAAKLLLLAAFVASRNKPTLDKELFEFRQQQGGRRRGRGTNRAETQAQQADRQAEAAREARLRGPHPFPLTRLISIFHRLWASAAPLESDAAMYGGKGLSYAAGGTVYGEEQDVLDVDLVTGFAGGRTGVEAVWSQSGAVLSAVTGLEAMGLLTKHGDRDDPLDQPRFLCALDEPLAQRLAADVRIQLNNYLMYDK